MMKFSDLSERKRINDQVAVEVMRHKQPFESQQIPCPDGKPGCAVMHLGLFDANGVRIPKYVYDLQDAWKVVTALSMDRDFVLSYVSPAHFGDGSSEPGHWMCYFAGSPDVTAETAPEAICRAALLAVASDRANGYTPKYLESENSHEL